MVLTLEDKLRGVIANIERSAKMAKMISINASVIAVRTRSDTQESFAFEAVAEQIKEISDDSISKIGNLRGVLGELRELSATINKAGRQRMLSQKIMKQYLIAKNELSSNRYGEVTALMSQFECNLSELERSSLNNEGIDLQLRKVRACWGLFKSAVDSDDLERAIATNDRVLEEMNFAVLKYEELSGG